MHCYAPIPWEQSSKRRRGAYTPREASAVVVGGHAGTRIFSDHCYAGGCHGPNNHAAGQSADNATLGTMLERSARSGGVWRRRWLGRERVVKLGGRLAPAAGFSGPKPGSTAAPGWWATTTQKHPNTPWPGQRTALHGAEQCWPLQRGAGQSGVGAAETGRIAVRERLHRRLFPLFWHEAREPLHRAGPPPDFRPKQLTQET